MISFEEMKKQREYITTNQSADELTCNDYVALSIILHDLNDITKEYIKTGKFSRFCFTQLETDKKCNIFITELKKYLPDDYKIKTFINVLDNGKRKIDISLDL